MKFLDDDMGMRDADSGDEVGISTQQIEQELAQAQQELIELPAGYQPTQKAAIQNRIAELLVDLQRGEEAFDIALKIALADLQVGVDERALLARIRAVLSLNQKDLHA